ncbi:MAG: glycerophosphodiester phosphodiesterase [Thermomicrobiales bacterium]
MLIYGHRGSSARLPENTIAALRGAIEDGADGVEFDIHASRDGVPVLIHDRELERTTNGHGQVDAQSLADLRNLDAGNGEAIPTFDEALAVIAGSLKLDVELKQAGAEVATLAALRGYPDAEWLISSFEWDILRSVRAIDPDAALWPLTEGFDDDLLAVADELGSPGVALWFPFFNEDTAPVLRERGLKVAVWTVNDADIARRMRDLGADVLISDDPAGIRSALAD